MHRVVSLKNKNSRLGVFNEARVGVEPTNGSFANCSVGPLRHRAIFRGTNNWILAYII